jgi:hypothetical protein
LLGLPHCALTWAWVLPFAGGRKQARAMRRKKILIDSLSPNSQRPTL